MGESNLEEALLPETARQLAVQAEATVDAFVEVLK